MGTRLIQLIVHIEKLFWKRKTFFHRYDLHVKLMAAKTAAANILVHLGTSPKLLSLFFFGGGVQWDEFITVQQKADLSFFL